MPSFLKARSPSGEGRDIMRAGNGIAGTILIGIFLLLILIVTLYPFVYVLSIAFMPYENYIASPVHLGPSGFTLANFRQIVRDPELPVAFVRSVVRVVAGTTLNIVCTMLCSYAVSRPKLRLRGIISTIFLIPMFFSAGLIPSYLTLRTYGLINTFWVLILPGLVSPMWFFITKSAMGEFPYEIIEAASMDGAGHWRIFWRIVMPANIPIVATLAMMYGIGHWNEYFMTRLVVQRDLWTAPVFLYNMMNTRIALQGLGVGARVEPQSFIAAVASCMILPVLLIYPFLQKYVVSGITSGAVKG